MKLSEKIERVIELQEQVKEVAKPIYEEWNNVTAEVICEILQRKSDKLEGGLLVTPLDFKIKGVKYQIVPEYMSKGGQFKNTVWKSAGPEMFSLRKV